ncbi:lysM domain protein [Mycobacterium xenopi 4042]|uniref:LysM domain protein n=1 Tax=Mycobacterium xenopi 4042 TaxID=1299334 RepID=X8CG89_MYCXE|nr:lysM domain protein [Mycobacterium xenopi 4042]
MSTAPHHRRPIGPATTVGLALLAALITLWLGVIAHFGETVDGAKPGPLPARLAVVRVDAGETLPHLAARVAPDAPVGQVVQRIRELNDLRSATLTAGQTLIARSADAPRCSAKPARAQRASVVVAVKICRARRSWPWRGARR